MSRSPNPLLMNQKQVMVGIEMDNQLCDHEANRKIDMNELKSLLAWTSIKIWSDARASDGR